MAYNVIANIDLDMLRPNANIVNAVQYDSSGRVVRARLVINGAAWAVPSGCYPVIRFRKSDRMGGFYDQDENNAYCISYENNRTVINITLALQVLTTAGNVDVQVNFYDASGQRVTTFAFKVRVQASVVPDDKIVSSEYYNALSATLAAAIDDIEAVKEVADIAEDVSRRLPTIVSDWLEANITNPSNPPIDKSLLVEDAAADAAVTGSVRDSTKLALGSLAFGDVTNGTVVFTSDDVSIGDRIYYELEAYTGYNGVLQLFDNNDNRLAYYGKASSSGTEDYYAGSFLIPANFSYANVGAGRSTTSYKMKIAWLGKNVKPSISVNNEKSLEKMDWRNDVFDPTKGKEGYALRYSDGAEIARTNFGITDYIPVFEGCKISKTWNLGSNTYGTVFYAADKQSIITIIPENKYEGDIIAPAGAYYFRTNYSVPYVYMIHIYVIPPQFNTVNDVPNYEVTKTGQLIDGLYTYSAFPVITHFNGQEVIAFRSAYEHFTRENNYGVTTIYVKNADGTIEFKRTIANNDEALAGRLDGEFRVGGLGVTPDGTKLILMGFTDRGGDNRNFSNVLILLDTNFEIVGVNIVESDSNYPFCGKITFTPDGYMVTTGYAVGQTRIVLFKSNQVYNNNFEQLTFEKSTICTGEMISEPDLGFTDNSLACIVRGHTANSTIIFASDKEGTSWGTPYELGSPLHSPRILEYSAGNYLVYGGARYVAETIRKPVIGVYDIANHKVVQESIIWDEHVCYGFYLDFVKYNDTIYDVVFYVDALARDATLSKIVYKRINIREVCPLINRYM